MTNHRPANAFSNKIKASILILIGGLVIYISTQMLMSNIYALQTNLFLSDWQNKANNSKETLFKPTEQAWLNAHQSSQKALDSSPVNNAFMQEQAGKIYQWKTYTQPFGDSNSQNNRQQALQAYREQIQITPKWPNAWLNLMAIKIELAEFDQEFYNAFYMAQQTANENPEISPQLTLLGIQAWSNLNRETKNKVLQTIVHEASLSKKNSQDLKPLLQAYNLLEISCIYARAIKENTYQLCR